jgi:hypothetical protein
MITSRSFFPSKMNSKLKLVDEQAGSILFVGHSFAPGIRHGQAAEGLNRFLILDCRRLRGRRAISARD